MPVPQPSLRKMAIFVGAMALVMLPVFAVVPDGAIGVAIAGAAGGITAVLLRHFVYGLPWRRRDP